MSLHTIPLPTSSSISLCTGVLGLFMALPLIALGRKRASNAWLGMFVLSLALLCIADFNRSTGLERRYPQLFGWFDWPFAALGAFYYCYARSLLGLGNSWRQAWLFLPLTAWVGLLLHLVWRGPVGIPIGPIFLFFQLFVCACAVLVLYRLHQYRGQLREQYSSTKGRDFDWLRWLTIVMLPLLAVWLLASIQHGIWHWLLLFGRLAVLFVLGWYGMLQASVFMPATPVEPPMPVQAVADVEPDDAPVDEPESGKYARSGMTVAAQQLIGKRLARRTTIERDHLDSDVNLGELAGRIGTSPQLLSQYLNEVLGMNFFDYINGLRVAEVQTMMGDPAMAERPLLDLAFASGFNSRSTFNAAFKKITGEAPSHWRKQQYRMSEPVG